jgi:hypothetical protein
LEAERTEFEARRTRLFEEVDSLKGNLMIREADFNAKLRSIELKEAETVRMAD